MATATIVYIHGMAGGHLERDGCRVWLSGRELARGSVAESLQGTLNPAGHLKLFHRPAALYWRCRGFAVHEFAYDWRASLDDAAARLRDTIASVPAAHRVRIAAHSMGGCVACRFSALYPDEYARVEKAFFFGVPVRGTFAAVDVILGRFALPRLVARASLRRPRKDVLHELSRATSQMPGLIDLFPDPALFPEAAKLYERSAWPPEFAPPRHLLDRSLALKPQLLASPILDRTTVLASPRDRVTTLSSALPRPGIPFHPLHLSHSFLLFELSGLRLVAAA